MALRCGKELFVRRQVLVLLLSVAAIAWVNPLRSRGASPKDEDATVETEKKEAIDAQTRLIQALKSNDPAVIAPFYADDFLLTTERFGKGLVLNKTQFLALKRSNQQNDARNVHDNVVARVYGNTVVLTGHSTSILRYKGKLSKGPRLFTFVWVKQDGRWQLVAGHVSDIPKGYETQ